LRSLGRVPVYHFETLNSTNRYLKYNTYSKINKHIDDAIFTTLKQYPYARKDFAPIFASTSKLNGFYKEMRTYCTGFITDYNTVGHYIDIFHSFNIFGGPKPKLKQANIFLGFFNENELRNKETSIRLETNLV
jgi:hypothetical protein